MQQCFLRRVVLVISFSRTLGFSNNRSADLLNWGGGGLEGKGEDLGFLVELGLKTLRSSLNIQSEHPEQPTCWTSQTS